MGYYYTGTATTGAFGVSYATNRAAAGGDWNKQIPKILFDASKCSSVYRNDISTVQPKSYTVLYIIKIKN